MLRSKQAVLMWLPLASLALAVAGCTKGPQRAAPVNPAQARDALKVALDGWKNGDKPDSLKSRTPPITVQDADWETGLRLVDYQVVNEGKVEDANLRCPVKLTLRDTDGHEVQRNVKYIIGTDPVITVFRELF